MESTSLLLEPPALTFPLPTRPKLALMELTYLARQWQPAEDPPLYGGLMASSEVDQKFLGHFAKTTSSENNYLSSFLFRVLGLSVILSEQLLRARRARYLDPVRDPKARHLIHHILWLAREGLVMVEQYILPMIENYLELKVLSYKLRASFYHIFVLFHNDPPVNNRVTRSRSASMSSTGIAGAYDLFPNPLVTRSTKSQSRSSRDPIRSPSGRQRSPAISLGGTTGKVFDGHDDRQPATGARRVPTSAPPGLGVPTPFSTNPYSTITPSSNGLQYYSSSNSKLHLDPSLATYLLPLADYTPHATSAFAAASTFADTLLPGSHPLRLSVKVEYVAYVYDCLKEAEVSRKMARGAIRHAYEAGEVMDDESFEDAAELVGILGKMMRRGLASAGTAATATTATTAATASGNGGRQAATPSATTNVRRSSSTGGARPGMGTSTATGVRTSTGVRGGMGAGPGGSGTGSGNASATSLRSPSQSQSQSRNRSRPSSGTSIGGSGTGNGNGNGNGYPTQARTSTSSKGSPNETMGVRSGRAGQQASNRSSDGSARGVQTERSPQQRRQAQEPTTWV